MDSVRKPTGAPSVAPTSWCLLPRWLHLSLTWIRLVLRVPRLVSPRRPLPARRQLLRRRLPRVCLLRPRPLGPPQDQCQRWAVFGRLPGSHLPASKSSTSASSGSVANSSGWLPLTFLNSAPAESAAWALSNTSSYVSGLGIRFFQTEENVSSVEILAMAAPTYPWLLRMSSLKQRNHSLTSLSTTTCGRFPGWSSCCPSGSSSGSCFGSPAPSLSPAPAPGRFPPGRRLRRQSLKQVVSVDGLVVLLLPQENVRGTPDATWLLGPRGSQDLRLTRNFAAGALHDQREPPRSLSSEPRHIRNEGCIGCKKERTRACSVDVLHNVAWTKIENVRCAFVRSWAVWSQGQSLTVTSACDLGKACHLGLYLLHAVTAKVWHSPYKPTHAPSSIIAFNRSSGSTTIKFQRVLHAPPDVASQNGWFIQEQANKYCNGSKLNWVTRLIPQATPHGN